MCEIRPLQASDLLAGGLLPPCLQLLGQALGLRALPWREALSSLQGEGPFPPDLQSPVLPSQARGLAVGARARPSGSVCVSFHVGDLRRHGFRVKAVGTKSGRRGARGQGATVATAVPRQAHKTRTHSEARSVLRRASPWRQGTHSSECRTSSKTCPSWSLSPRPACKGLGSAPRLSCAP